MSKWEDPILNFIDDEDGTTTQKEITENIATSRATVSRILTDLEDRGVIVRCRYGGNKKVWLAHKAPRSLRYD